MAMHPVPGQGGDPSMDDILASIRKILNEDDTQPATAPAAAPPPAAAAVVPEEDEVMDLTSDMMIAPPPTEAAAAVEPELPAVAPVAERAAPPPPPAPPVPQPQALPQPSLVSLPVAAAAAASLGQLSRAVAQDRAASVSRSMGLSIEDVVREEVRPLLKEWLDAHLPPLVERLVRAEIERVMARAG